MCRSGRALKAKYRGEDTAEEQQRLNIRKDICKKKKGEAFEKMKN